MFCCYCSVAKFVSDSFVTTGWVSLSMGFSRQEYWSGLSFPPLGDLPDLGIEPMSPSLAGGFFTVESPRNPRNIELK